MDSFSGKFDEAKGLVMSAKRILLATHEDPDGDGLGALLAFLLWLKDIGVDKPSHLFADHQAPREGFETALNSRQGSGNSERREGVDKPSHLFADHQAPREGFETALNSRQGSGNSERGEGKEVTAFIKGDLPDYLSFLPGTEMCVGELPEGEFDLLVGFDYADFKRLGLTEWVARQSGLNIITFDHHPGGRYKGDILFVDPSAASSTSMVYRFFNHIGAVISPDVATCVLCGIVSDTGGFVHSNTSSEAFMVAGEMMRRGADLARINREVFRKKDPKYLRLWGEALFRTHFDKEIGLVISRVTLNDLKKYDADKEAMVDFSSVLGSVDGSRCSVLLSQDRDCSDHIKGSLRSEEYKNFDVSVLAAAFGGGGHKLASGFRIKGTWSEVIEKLIKEVGRV